MKKILSVFLLASAITLASGPKVPYNHPHQNVVEMANVGRSKEIKWVKVADIEKSLQGKKPMNVSFDIDDTVLFSSPAFYYGKVKYSPDSFKFLKDQTFWNFVGDGGDRYSIPKSAAAEIIAMHQRRGDTIYFITGRTAPEGLKKGELDDTAKILQKVFKIKDMHPISYQTPYTASQNKYDKTYYIKKYNVTLHYGDSDEDILAAKEAGIRGIRILRNSQSTNKPLPGAGGYGEEVVINSQF
ncbi:acid phosphatase (class B) [Cetobacterium ceti]|uniref:Class B acid phosphatase n=1 Tax=Cetobacterium ceti TaxID=180163 RepID=A0A1T4PII1_9FUSO|nr:acid phosphatase AphA [Cetobacterium ceti]SJZ90648.1 acid phosphatase (class B) [Cetobacterium ceti]